MIFAFYTLGCKVNQYESNVMSALVEKQGHTVSNDLKTADCVIVNSCTVTAESDRKTRQAVRRIRKNNPTGIVILTGCMPQAFPNDASALTEADIVMGNNSLNNLNKNIEKFMLTGERVIDLCFHKKGESFDTPTIEHFNERTRAYLKIEDGCERYCTYCIIPKARGFVRSKSPREIEKEVSLLAKGGHKEIVLVGINLSTYGKGEEYDLCDAVEAVAKVDDVKRIRLGSLEPDLFTEEMLERLSRVEKFCPQFHFSLQSGCDDTLRRMNRHYDSQFYFDLISRVRSKFNNPSITTDIMVGFAGETEEEFEKSLAFAKKAGFARAHIFAYSRREGTVAYLLPNQVASAQKERRAHLMSDACKQCEKDFLKTQVGLLEEVLFEQFKEGYSTGYTKNYTPVKAEGNFAGEIKQVEITDTQDLICIGKIKSSG